MAQVEFSLLQRPVFLSTLPVKQFDRLDRKYLFAELARLDKLLDQYPDLIARQSDFVTVSSLKYCQDLALARYNELRRLA